MRIRLGTLIAALLVAGGAGAQNLLQNGSFEEPDVAGGTADFFASIPGWVDVSTSPQCGIEVQDHCCGSPSNGPQHVELDSTCAGAIRQTVATQPGASYVLSFDYSPRPGVFTNDLDVHWNEELVFSLFGRGTLLPETDWTHHTAVVTATGATSTIQFTDPALGDSDGAGTYVDNVPEPGRSAQLVAGMLFVAGLGWLRRRRVR